MTSEAFNPSHSRSFWCNADREQSHVSPTSSLMWRRGAGIWEESNIRTGESSVVDFVLFFPEALISMLLWASAWHSHFSSFTWKCKLWTKSTANSCKLTFIVHFHCTLLHWRMKLEGKMRNISSKEIQVDISNKSNNIFIAHCTFSLHIVHFHCTLLHWRMKLEGRNAKYWPKRNTSQQSEQIQLDFKPPERWPNQGMTVRRP